MFVLELGRGIAINSTGLVADCLDMLSDACVYAIALAAIIFFPSPTATRIDLTTEAGAMSPCR